MLKTQHFKNQTAVGSLSRKNIKKNCNTTNEHLPIMRKIMKKVFHVGKTDIKHIFLVAV